MSCIRRVVVPFVPNCWGRGGGGHGLDCARGSTIFRGTDAVWMLLHSNLSVFDCFLPLQHLQDHITSIVQCIWREYHLRVASINDRCSDRAGSDSLPVSGREVSKKGTTKTSPARSLSQHTCLLLDTPWCTQATLWAACFCSSSRNQGFKRKRDCMMFA